MDDSIATAPRDILRIAARRARHLAFLGSRKYLVPGSAPDAVSTLRIYPGFDHASDAADVLNRLGWYLPPSQATDLRVHVDLGETLDLSDVTADHVPSAHASYGWDHLDIVPDDAVTDASARSTADAIAVWDWSWTSMLRRCLDLPRVAVVDPWFYSTVESTTWPTLTARAAPEGTSQSEDALERLLTATADDQESYVFATGPSLDRIFEHDVPDDAVSIVCNSTVRDDALLDHLDPDVLVFADPVFHFGSSRYAATFREDAVHAISEYDCTCVVPRSYRRLLVERHPEVSASTVGLTVEDTDAIVTPTCDDPGVASTGNIMTSFMLPIAMAVSESITIVGADGREEDASYFWQHSDTAQYDDALMQTVVDTHPSFFRDRRYTDYYERHIRTLERYVDHAESRGITVESLTPSHVECLQQRLVDDPLGEST